MFPNAGPGAILRAAEYEAFATRTWGGGGGAARGGPPPKQRGGERGGGPPPPEWCIWCGSDTDLDQSVTLLRTYLKNHRARQDLFNQAWLLWASKGLDGLLTPDERKTVIFELLELQQADGGWRLASLGTFARHDGTPQETASDGYATAFVLHVLQSVGVSKGDPKIAQGLDWLIANQRPTGEWPASSVNKSRDPTTHVGRFMSDAATAYAILALSH